MFEAIGLTQHEEQLYLELLREPGQTRTAITSALPGWPESRTIRTLKALIAHGLITTLAGRPPRYSPIAPDLALDSLSRKRIGHIHEIGKLIPGLMEQYWRVHREHTAGDVVEILSGEVESIRTRILQLQGAAREEVRALVRRPYATNPNIPAQVELDALELGVRYRVVYEQSEIQDPERWPDLRLSIVSGEEARVFDGLPVKLTVFDEWAATISLTSPSGNYAGTIVVHRSPLLDALTALFEVYWSRSVPLVLSPQELRKSPGPFDDELVKLLAAGLTDQTIARVLGLSRSTVQRRINELLAREGAKTRFQLGLQLGRRLGFPDDGAGAGTPSP